MIRSTLASFRNASIQTKLIITFGIFFMIPLLASSAILYLTTANDAKLREYDRWSKTLLLLQNGVESEIRALADRTEEIYYDRRLFSPFQMSVPPRLDGLALRDLSQALQSYRAGQNYLDSIYLFLANGQYTFADTATNGRFAGIYLAHPEWASAIERADGRVRWLASVTIPKDATSSVDNVAFGRLIRNIYSGTFFKIGILVVNLNMQLFDKVGLSNDIGRGGVVFITDADGRLIWCADRTWYERSIAASALVRRLEASLPADLTKVHVGGSFFYAAHRHSSYNGWHYFALIPEGTILDQVLTLRYYFVAVLVICMVFFGLGAVIIRRYITVPLERLIVAMNEIIGHEVSPTLPAITRSDEIGFLYKSFNSMFARIRNLIGQIEYSHQNERAYEMQALQAQINPHFLYNTLDTINWLAREKKETTISRMLTSLSRILQYAISNSNGMVRWQDELRWLENYVFIQQTRFEGKFQIRYDVDDQILGYRTFRLLLQPFVENSIVHGFRDLQEGGLITVRGRCTNGRVEFEITDNGCGMDGRTIEEVIARSPTSVGIRNVNERIRLTFGPSFGVSVSSGLTEGTTVVITFPILDGEGS